MTVVKKIAVTPRSVSQHGHPALELLTAAGYELVFPAPGRLPTLEEQVRFLPECVGYLAGTEPIPGELLRRCPHLRVIGRNGVGVDAIDLCAAEELGIAVEKAEGANAQGVAELTIALMLGGLRHVPWSSASIKAGAWKRKEGIEARGRVLGVIGCGQIGRRVAQMGLGLGMTVRAHDQFEDPAFNPGEDFSFAPLATVLGTGDVITLHCPPSPRPVIDAAATALMKRGSYLINTARAALVDQAAVLRALEEGILSGFATDVYDSEPPVIGALLARDDVIATPHAGGLTVESVDRAVRGAVQNMLRVLQAPKD